MKKMWKLNNKAVSPVIATILMVAITVVLAAVLYVMVMGFGGEDNTAPTAVLGNPDITPGTPGNYTAVIQLVSISPETALTDLQYKVGTAAPVSLPATAFTDVAADGQASNGDFFTLTVTADTTLYLIYEPTGDVIDQVVINI